VVKTATLGVQFILYTMECEGSNPITGRVGSLRSLDLRTTDEAQQGCNTCIVLVFPYPHYSTLELGSSYAPRSRHNVSCHSLPLECAVPPQVGRVQPNLEEGISVYPLVYAIMCQAIGHHGTCLPPLYNATPPSFRYTPSIKVHHGTVYVHGSLLQPVTHWNEVR